MAEGRNRAGGRTGALRAPGLAAPHRPSAAGWVSAEVLCHTGGPNDDGSGSVPPIHSSDCLVCPLCAALHAPAPVLGSGPVVPVPAQAGFRPAVVYAPVVAPPRADYPPLQARAPPLT